MLRIFLRFAIVRVELRQVEMLQWAHQWAWSLAGGQTYRQLVVVLEKRRPEHRTETSPDFTTAGKACEEGFELPGIRSITANFMCSAAFGAEFSVCTRLGRSGHLLLYLFCQGVSPNGCVSCVSAWSSVCPHVKGA